MIKGEVHSRYLEAFLLALKEGFMQWSLKTVSSTVLRHSSYMSHFITGGKSTDNSCHQHLFTVF